MSRDNLGSKQNIVLHNCLNKNERYDLVITQHRQTIGYIRSKRQTRKKTIITKQRKLSKNGFQNDETQSQNQKKNTAQELQNLKDSINKNNPIDDQVYISDSEARTP